MSEWIEREDWGVAGCPVSYSTIVDIKFEDGREAKASRAGSWTWVFLGRGVPGCITAYRLTLSQQSMEEAYDETHKEIGDSALDQQHGGDHYKKLGDYQPWEVLRHWLTPEEFRGYMKGEAITYLARERSKGGTLDINKAAHTLKALLELEGK